MMQTGVECDATGMTQATTIRGAMAMDVNPIEVQKHLSGMEYPASKDDVVSTAESNGAPQEIIEALQRMDAEEFDGPNAVQAALS